MKSGSSALRSGPWRLSRISQAQSPPNHNALLHLSINCTHLHIISTLISLHTKAHSSHQLILRFCFIRSGLMLLQQVTCLLTLITYLPPEERTHFAFSDTLQNGAMVTLRYGKKYFFIFFYKKYSRRAIRLRLNH